MNSVAYLPQSKRLLEQMREGLRYKHYSLKTEQAYLYWVRFSVRWHGFNGLMQPAAGARSGMTARSSPRTTAPALPDAWAHGAPR